MVVTPPMFTLYDFKMAGCFTCARCLSTVPGFCRWQKKSAKLDGRDRKYTDEFVIIFVTDRQMKTRKNSDCFEIQYL
ncbi:uncharacterized protein TNIN_240481 [Trichonephila inaurata madagascariensis]|uniref:Uncharacterized protein n=1 Tax=Trichonephila inaurata madagascariensis TaxID=2747483 RepID=A0A8X7CI01_9ARAC|nr:uncharacterized protein TNIN_240481 [Trichonephila inaurata madagascariensis]